MSRLGRNAPCHCGSGRKYKHCHLPSELHLRAPVKGTPEVIDYHKVFDGLGWTPKPGTIAQIKLTGREEKDVDKEIEDLFATTFRALTDPSKIALGARLNNAKHKVYGARFHLLAIEQEIDQRAAAIVNGHTPPSGATLETENLTLTYNLEAFLFQVKSSLDMMVPVLAHKVPALKNYRSFAHSGSQGSPSYRAGGKIIDDLAEHDEATLSSILERHRAQWIQQVTVDRDVVAHLSSLKTVSGFVEEPYRGGDTAVVSLPTIAGKRLDTYAAGVYADLLELFREVLVELVSALGKAKSEKSRNLQPES